MLYQDLKIKFAQWILIVFVMMAHPCQATNPGVSESLLSEEERQQVILRTHYNINVLSENFDLDVCGIKIALSTFVEDLAREFIEANHARFDRWMRGKISEHNLTLKLKDEGLQGSNYMLNVGRLAAHMRAQEVPDLEKVFDYSPQSLLFQKVLADSLALASLGPGQKVLEDSLFYDIAAEQVTNIKTEVLYRQMNNMPLEMAMRFNGERINTVTFQRMGLDSVSRPESILGHIKIQVYGHEVDNYEMVVA